MKIRFFRLASIIGLLLLIGAAAWWLRPANSNASKNTGLGAVDTAQKPVAQSGNGVSASEPEKPASGPNPAADETVRAGVKEMRRAFTNADNMRMFIHEAMAHPEQGGRYYAKLAYDICFHTNLLRLPEEKDVKSEGQRKALVELMRWKDRCAGVDEQVGDRGNFIRRVIANDGATGQDVLVRGSATYNRANESKGPITPARALTRLDAASRLEDPWLMSDVISSYTPMLLEAIAPEVATYLRPEWSLILASSISCELTETCVHGRVTIMRCAMGGPCFDDERVYILSTVPADQLDAFNAARAAVMKRIRSTP
jgi:hypothetical protein